MGELPFLIPDLALILLIAGVTTLLFKRPKQPLVLGYIVAGMLAGPAISLFPSIQDMTNVKIWADIGVIFLLFALGLEFSFKKLMSVGRTGIITASVEVLCILIVGYCVGRLMGWGYMNSIFLGGMMSISSTTIIIKTFNDLNLRGKKFTNMVFAVLVVEDLVAVILMVLLSTVAVSKNFSGGDMLLAILKLVFFLSIWFIFGIYIIPSLLKKTRSMMNDETLLIVSVGLCLGMVVLAVKSGFSSALGAFIMGSILAETYQVERIENLMKPLKDLFGAVFFVSVGMMVNLSTIWQYIIPILIVTLAVILCKLIFPALGMLLSGQSLKVSIQSAFSLAQIGEFSFIIAGLGMSLGVISDFLYPVIIAVSVITTFCTPYIMRLSSPAYKFVYRHLPKKWRKRLSEREVANRETKDGSDWGKLIKAYLSSVLILSIIVVALIMLSTQFLYPFLMDKIPSGPWAAIITTLVTLLVLSPFLKALMSKRNKTSGYMMNLWMGNELNRLYIIILIVIRIVLAFVAIAYVLFHFLPLPTILILPIALLLLYAIFRSKKLLKHYWRLESRFMINLNERQMEDNIKRAELNKGVWDAQDLNDVHWLDRTLYSFAMKVGPDSCLIGRPLKDMAFRTEYNLIIIRVTRGQTTISIPGGDFLIEEYDVLTFAGRNIVLSLMRTRELDMTFVTDTLVTLNDFSHQEGEKKSNSLCCSGIPVRKESPVAGKSLRESQIGRKNKCMIIGIERGNEHIINPDSEMKIKVGDLLWVIAEDKFVSELITENVYLL